MMKLLHRRLAKRGYQVYSFGYASLKCGLDEILATLDRQIQSLPEAIIHLVGYSLGGIIACRYVNRNPPLKIGRIVLIASPIAGATLAQSSLKRLIGRLLMGRSLDILAQPQIRAINIRETGAIAGDWSLGLSRLLISLPQPNDGVVTVAETQAPWLKQHIVLPIPHFLAFISGAVADEVAQFLQSGRFSSRFASE